MTRYLLDTNIISDVTKAVPSPLLIEWLAEQLDEDLFISSLSLAEIRRGVLEKPTGKKRRQLGEPASLIWARLMSEGTAAGRPRNALDMVIAATAEANDCILVTDNEKHFPGIKILNPHHSARRRGEVEH
jgi:predicted nucleic acid-binding protein